MDVANLYEQLEQKKRVITTWEYTLKRAQGEVDRLNQEINELASQLAKYVVEKTDKVDA